jgi:hypothetical protein
MTPVLVIPGTDYVICFEAAPEDMSMHFHFVKECAWTEEQFEEIEDFAWFNADVSLWHRGVMLGEEYLGACCYAKPEEFYTRYAADYFADMVRTLVADHIPGLNLWAKRWAAGLREKTTLREVQA